jgi:hypothetical protein
VSYLAICRNGAGGKPPSSRKKSEFSSSRSRCRAGRASSAGRARRADRLHTPERCAEQLRAILREASAAAARAAHHRHRQGLPRARLASRRERDPDLPADRRQRPVSLSVLRRPGETPRWAVALSEIVDDAARRRAEHPALVSPRLHLPRALPPQSLADAEPGASRGRSRPITGWCWSGSAPAPARARR